MTLLLTQERPEGTRLDDKSLTEEEKENGML